MIFQHKWHPVINTWAYLLHSEWHNSSTASDETIGNVWTVQRPRYIIVTCTFTKCQHTLSANNAHSQTTQMIVTKVYTQTHIETSWAEKQHHRLTEDFNCDTWQRQIFSNITSWNSRTLQQSTAIIRKLAKWHTKLYYLRKHTNLTS